MATLKELEHKFKDVLHNELEENFVGLKEPNCVFFTAWTFTNPEGRLSYIFKKNKGESKNFNLDNERWAISRLWQFIFQDMREDYLVEKMWRWMAENEQDSYKLKFLFKEPNTKSNYKDYIIINKSFIKSLKGDELRRKINDRIQDKSVINNKHLGYLLKYARILRYTPEFNNCQIGGINEGFSKWVNSNENEKRYLNRLFKMFYSKKNPERNPIEAQNYLTMWQNFSLVFPDFESVIIDFYWNKDNPEYRYALANFYNKSNGEVSEVSKYSNEIMEEICNNQMSSELNIIKNGDNRDRNAGSSNLWDEVKDRGNHKGLWAKLIPEIDIDNLMRLAGNLAFSEHEAEPSKFTFIAGTEQIWPSLEETISLRFYNDDNLTNRREFDVHIMSGLMEANYSIFRTDNILAFYNVKYDLLKKIVRLRHPTRNEARQLEDPICDIEDLYCWWIEKIFETTTKSEKCYIIHTTGNGKVLVFGIKEDERKADLLLIWNVRDGSLYEPLSEDKLKKISTHISKKLDLDKDHMNYKKLVKSIRKISSIPGEGACLIVTTNKKNVDDHLATMELLNPSWVETLNLDDPQFILKAAFIMDGACLLTKESIIPRMAIYPNYDEKAWGLLRNIESLSDDNFELISKNLSGKGSKTHGSVNLTTIPDGDDIAAVISISADGPVKIWPDDISNRS